MYPREPRRLGRQPSPATARRPHLPHALRHGGRACWGATPTRWQPARQTGEHQIVGRGPRAVSSATNTSRTSQACPLIQLAVLHLRASHRKQAACGGRGSGPRPRLRRAAFLTCARAARAAARRVELHVFGCVGAGLRHPWVERQQAGVRVDLSAPAHGRRSTVMREGLRRGFAQQDPPGGEQGGLARRWELRGTSRACGLSSGLREWARFTELR